MWTVARFNVNYVHCACASTDFRFLQIVNYSFHIYVAYIFKTDFRKICNIDSRPFTRPTSSVNENGIVSSTGPIRQNLMYLSYCKFLLRKRCCQLRFNLLYSIISAFLHIIGAIKPRCIF